MMDKATSLARAALVGIPIVDVREGGAVRHAVEGRERALALRDACVTFFPRPFAFALPLVDGMARRWLRRSHSPYLAEIEAIAKTLGFPGVWFLNGSYQWGCTSLVREEGGVPWLARTLDWPFPGLGRHVEVARMQGPAGEFYTVTWPGYVGTLTAMAPGRFGAAINQAPMFRRTRHHLLRFVDLMLNAVSTWRHIRHMPPDQLLRQAFETCATFEEARALLETTPVARPVIFTLAGSRPGEACVIERTEDGFTTRCEQTAAANDWHVSAYPWEARVGGDVSLTCAFEEAAAGSRARQSALLGWTGPLAPGGFDWVCRPVLNRYTRIAVAMCPASGALRVAGYELASDVAAEPATAVCEISAERVAA